MHFFSHVSADLHRNTFLTPDLCTTPRPYSYLTGTSAIKELEFLIKILYLASRGHLDPLTLSPNYVHKLMVVLQREEIGEDLGAPVFLPLSVALPSQWEDVLCSVIYNGK